MLTTVLFHGFLGWLFWSFSHFYMHKRWHKDILNRKPGLATHGESEHHRCYDKDEGSHLRDPFKALASFPYPFILAQVALLCTWYGITFGWLQGLSFFTTAFLSMTIDDRLHKLWHNGKDWGGFMGHLQKLHQIHHTTHKNNYSFFSGLIWDKIANTRLLKFPNEKQELENKVG